MDINSDKYKVRARSLLFCDLDIIAIAETHLCGDASPVLEGYTSFVHNRRHIHKRAKIGSGGLCVFIRTQLLTHFEVTVLDDSIEDILWVKLLHRESNQCYSICVCYLSPEGSSRMVDPHEYFENLLSQIYIYQTLGQFMICGDFNARCGDEADYIVGVDEIEPRNVVDYRKNSYGDIFLDLLINSNCAMLNGRLGGINDFTSVSVKGTAVVDYVFVSYDVLRCYRDISVRRAHKLFELAALVGVCDPDHNIPDHSLLSWSVMFDESNIFDYNDLQSHVRTVYDVTQIPMEFMCHDQNKQNMNRLINSCTSANINDSYDSFCYLIQNEMQSSLPAKRITVNSAAHRNTKKTMVVPSVD